MLGLMLATVISSNMINDSILYTRETGVATISESHECVFSVIKSTEPVITRDDQGNAILSQQPQVLEVIGTRVDVYKVTTFMHTWKSGKVTFTNSRRYIYSPVKCNK